MIHEIERSRAATRRARVVSASERSGFRSDVEGVRGLAVIVVVLFHAGLLGLVGGFIGVDVFFVISGFLITGLLLREHERTGRIRLLPFYARRVRRLLPAATVVLVATLLIALNLVAPLDRPGVGLDGAAAALSIGNVRFAMAAGDYFASVGAPSPFLHFWSLAVEEQFYLVWPALILLVARGLHARRRVTVTLVVVVVASFGANILLTDAAANWAFYLLPTRAWELGLGGLLACGAVGLGRLPERLVGLAGWAGLAAIATSAVMFDSNVAWPGSAALVPAVGTVLVLAGGSRHLGPGKLLSTAPLRFLGKVSYSLYLVHWPILVLAPFVINGPADDLTRAGLVSFSIAASFACYRFVETPFRAGLPRLAMQPGRTVSFGMAAIAIVVVMAAGPSIGVTTVGGAAAFDRSDGTTTATAPDASDEAWVDEVDASTGSTRPTQPASAGPGATPTATGTATPTAGPPDASPAAPSWTATASPAEVVGGGALPADVKPALELARSDEERLRGDGCLAFEPVTRPPDCVYGDKSGRFTVALVGDSHAAQWFPALERLARREGWRLVTFVKVSCPFIDLPVRNLALKRVYRECADFNEATVARLRAIKPQLTLISMSRMAIHPISDADSPAAIRAAAIGRMVARIPGDRAIIVDTPYAKVDVPGCLSAHRAEIDVCAIPRSVGFGHDFADIESAAANAGGAGIIDMTARFTGGGDGPIPVVIGRKIVYRDGEHMTATFARSLSPALAAAIAGLFPTD